MALFLFLPFSPGYAQETSDNSGKPSAFKLHHKGEFAIHWGYNRSWYNRSTIHFTGEGYDFKLEKVKAKDHQSEINLDYVDPGKWSVPQFNIRFVYFLSDNYSISIGWDHMKYVGVDNQKVIMNGYVHPEEVTDQLMQRNMERLNEKYGTSGDYRDAYVQMTPRDFIHIEHTDGLNYASIAGERYWTLWQSEQHDKLGLVLVGGWGAGIVVPRTDAHLFASGRNHLWNLSGWGTSVKTGIQFNITRHIYVLTDFKYGYLNLVDIRTTNHYSTDKAKQKIIFYESYWQLGVRF